MRRKMTAFLLILVLVITGLLGCDAKDKNETGKQSDEKQVNGQQANGEQTDKKSTQMGRYMEKEVNFPELEEKETVIKIIQNSDGRIELYTKIKGKYQCYLLKEDMTWEKGQAGWLNDGKLSGDQVELTDLCCGEDGNYYAVYSEYSEKYSKSHIIKSEDKGKTEKEIKLAYLNTVKSSTDKYDLYPSIQKLLVLKNSDLVLDDYMANDMLLIFSSEGEKLDELPTIENNNSNSLSYAVSENVIIAADKDRKGIVIYDTDSKSKKTIDYEVGNRSMAFTRNAEGTVYMEDEKGIHRLNKDSTLWETTVDGALNSMSMPSLIIDKLIVKKGAEEQYYCVCQNTDGGYKLLSYVFDKNIASAPSHEITVYSLQENNTVRQAISLFQAKNTDIKVNYIVAMGEEGGTVSDYIRALNTELLAGSGADVLVLDGLPVDSYIEKGVLADISDVIKPLEDSGELLPNITDCYNSDGKIYELPLRFRFPVMVGKEEALSSLKDMDSILNCVKQSGGKPFVAPISYRLLTETYLALYSKDLYDNGELNRDKLYQFLQNLKALADNIKATEKYEYSDDSSETDSSFINMQTLFMNPGLGIMKGKYLATTVQLGNIYGAMMPITLAKQCNLHYTSMNRRFIPDGLVGLNGAGKDIKNAKQFIRFLYSKEVQDTDVYQGFPVNVDSLNSWIDKEDDGWFGTGDREGNELSTRWPTKEERKVLLKVISDLQTPIEMNQITDGIIINETLSFLTGSIDANEAADTAYSKINTYLSE